jgi:hypothetical protein
MSDSYNNSRIADLERRMQKLEAVIVSAAKNVNAIEDRCAGYERVLTAVGSSMVDTTATIETLAHEIRRLQATSHPQLPGEIEP